MIGHVVISGFICEMDFTYRLVDRQKVCCIGRMLPLVFSCKKNLTCFGKSVRLVRIRHVKNKNGKLELLEFNAHGLKLGMPEQELVPPLNWLRDTCQCDAPGLGVTPDYGALDDPVAVYSNPTFLQNI